MKRFSIRTLLIVCFVLALLIGYFRDSLIRITRSNWTPYKLVETEDEFEQMLAAKNAVMFIHVDWSIGSVLGKRSVDEFATDWKWDSRRTDVDFYLIDHTEQDLQFLVDWANSDRVGLGTVAYGGYGTLIWLRDGEVLKVANPSTGISPDDLAEQTELLLGP